MNGYTHFVNKISDNNLIIVSRPKTEDFSYIVAFLFLTLVFYFCLTLLTLTRIHPRQRESNYYKSRINAAMLMALVMTLIALATVSVLFVYRRNNANLKSSMADKVNSLQTLLQGQMPVRTGFHRLQRAGGVSHPGGHQQHDEVRHHPLHHKRQGIPLHHP